MKAFIYNSLILKKREGADDFALGPCSEKVFNSRMINDGVLLYLLMCNMDCLAAVFRLVRLIRLVCLVCLVRLACLPC